MERNPEGTQIRAKVTPDDEIGTDDEAAWREAGQRLFETAYSSDDSIYEQLIHDASTQ